MSATGSTLITRVRDLIQESSASAWTDAQIREQLNLILDELWDIVQRWTEGSGKLLEVFTAVTMTSGTAEVDYPSTLSTIDKIEVKDAVGDWHELIKVTVTGYRSGLDEGDPPTHYLPRDDGITLSPPPSTTRTGAIRFWGTPKKTAWTAANIATATSNLPDSCDRGLIYGCVGVILDVENPAMAASFNRRFEQYKMELPTILDFMLKQPLDPDADVGVRWRYPGGEDLDS